MRPPQGAVEATTRGSGAWSPPTRNFGVPGWQVLPSRNWRVPGHEVQVTQNSGVPGWMHTGYTAWFSLAMAERCCARFQLVRVAGPGLEFQVEVKRCCWALELPELGPGLEFRVEFQRFRGPFEPTWFHPGTVGAGLRSGVPG